MKMSKEEYKKYVEKRAARSPTVKNCLWAFFVGGGICTFGHFLTSVYVKYLELDKTDAGSLTSVTLIFIAILLTGFGVFDKIACRAGAGTLVPITGFANAVSSAAIDSKTEGFILGVGANMFKISGPVIVYGITAGVVYGVVYWVMGLF